MLRSIPEVQIWRQFTGSGALDLYSGIGGVARNLLKNGGPFVVAYDWKRSSVENLLDSGLQDFLLKLISLGTFDLVGSAVIYSSFSKAVTPQVRSPRFPRGIPWMRHSMRSRVADGNNHADFNARLLNLCRAKQVMYRLENPDSSYLWIQRGFSRYRRPDSQHLFRADFCRFGCAWRKRSRVATSIPSLCCPCAA